VVCAQMPDAKTKTENKITSINVPTRAINILLPVQ